jgi:hypothetical protein
VDEDGEEECTGRWIKFLSRMASVFKTLTPSATLVVSKLLNWSPYVTFAEKSAVVVRPAVRKSAGAVPSVQDRPPARASRFTGRVHTTVACLTAHTDVGGHHPLPDLTTKKNLSFT